MCQNGTIRYLPYPNSFEFLLSHKIFLSCVNISVVSYRRRYVNIKFWPILIACEFKADPFGVQPTCNVSFHYFQDELARFIVALYQFWIIFQGTVYDSECKNSWVKCHVPVQLRPILAWKSYLFCSVSIKQNAFSFNRRTSFMFRWISVLIFSF